MKYVRNENGMALVTVLLMFTVFTVLGIVVFSSIMNNMKQITKTEGDIQATDLAEMGVTYYKTAIQDSIEKVNVTGAASINTYYSELKTKIEFAVNGAKKPISGDDVYFEIVEYNDNKYNLTSSNKLSTAIPIYFDKTTDNIRILLKSKGSVQGVPRALSLYMVYDIRLNPYGSFSINVPATSELSADCGTALIDQNYNQDKCIYDGDQLIGSLNNVKDSTLYITGDLNATTTLNNVDGGKIHVKGDIYTPQLVNIDGTSQIEVEGSAIIDKINNTDGNIRLIVGNDLTVKTINTLRESFIEVFGNATLGNFPTPNSGDLSNITDSIIVIHGNAKLPSSISELQGTSKICVFGQLEGFNNTTNPDDKVYVKGESGFESSCGAPYGGNRKYILNTVPEESVEYD